MPKPLNILLIEDDVEDAELLIDALTSSNILHSIEILTDGLKINEYINAESKFPDLIVMDFNLPLLHGRDVLVSIKKSRLKDLPVVVLTTSSSSDDKKYVYEHGGAKFITKPSSMDEIKAMVSDIASLAGKIKN